MHHTITSGDQIEERLMTRYLKWAATAVGAAALSVSIAADQTGGLNRVMRDKLAHSQKILEALVTSDWGELERHSLALKALTKESAWSVLRSPEYADRTKAFTRALEDLIDAAERRDLEEAPLAYASLTLGCVQCHRYVARARIARALGPPGPE